MKAHTLLVTLTICLLFTAAGYALTREWGVQTGVTITSLRVDTKGGCAVTSVETNGIYAIAWIDAKGNVKYQKSFAAGTQAAVVKCGKKTLVYFTVNAASRELVQVDKKNQESTTTSTKVINPVNALESTDKKGFFVLEFDTNQVPTLSEIVRYSDK
jgi:hypothetical protein